MDYSFRELRGKRSLFLGEVNSGKTTLTSKLIEQAAVCRSQTDGNIVVIDLAPESLFRMEGRNKVGGKLQLSQDARLAIKYYSPPNIYAPRSIGRTKEEVLFFSKENVLAIDRSLENAGSVERISSLFVNDVTMYFHAGSADKIADLSKRTETFIANGYSGKSLADDKGSGVSDREAKETMRLASFMDNVFTLQAP